MNELIDYMNDDTVESVILKAAMGHLKFVMLHPFSDGNGRAARCLQTAVLASEGIVAPVFSSIEEYIGRHQQEYYDVLAAVGGGAWNPNRDCANYGLGFVLRDTIGKHKRCFVELKKSGAFTTI